MLLSPPYLHENVSLHRKAFPIVRSTLCGPILNGLHADIATNFTAIGVSQLSWFPMKLCRVEKQFHFHSQLHAL